MDKRTEVLRRLGGPVCPICEKVSHDVEVRFLDVESVDVVREKNPRYVVQQSTAPMCGRCFMETTNEAVRRRSEKVARDVRAAEWLVRRGEEEMRHIARMGDSRSYRDACSEHEADLQEALKIGSEWGVGNGLEESIFGRRKG